MMILLLIRLKLPSRKTGSLWKENLLYMRSTRKLIFGMIPQVSFV
jgi:hypothetical protein